MVCRSVLTTAMHNDDTTVKHRPRRWLRLVGVVALLMFAVAMVFGAFYVRKAKNRLAEAMAAADRDDPNWRLDDLLAQREEVPDAENSAKVLATLAPLLPRWWPPGPKPRSDGLKPVPSDAMGAYDRTAKSADNVQMDETMAGSLRAELKVRDEAVQIARRVANFSRGRHELKLGPNVIDTLLPETEAARSAARLLAADAAIRAHDGDIDGALDSCRAILEVSRSIGDEPFMISQLVRIAIDALALKSARRALGQGEPSIEVLARLQAVLMDELKEPRIVYAMNGERATLTEMLRRLSNGAISISAIGGGAGSAPSGLQRAIGPWLKPMFDYQRALALEWMNEAVAIARRPASEQPKLWAAWEAKMARIKQDQFGRFTAVLPLLLVPAASAASTAFIQSQCELGATAILIAAERHRRKTGKWPASIAAIDRDILPIAPIDAFSGQPFRMEYHDGKLVIYSIGANGKDEHGAFDQRRSMFSGPDDLGAAAWDVSLRRRQPDPSTAAHSNE